MLAVLEKRCGFKLGAKDVFLNIAGGLKVDDPAIDLAVVCSVLSSNVDMPVSQKICLSAEVGLSGEIRPVNRIDQRIAEAEKLGFQKIVISKYNKGVDPSQHKIKIIPGGVDFTKLQPPAGYAEQIDKKYKLKGKKVVLFVGRLIKSKGLQYLIKAAPQIHGTILIIGDGPDKKLLEEEVEKKLEKKDK